MQENTQNTWDNIQEFCVTFGQTAWGYLSNLWVVGGLVALFVVLLIIVLRARRQPPRIRAFSNGSGYVEISRAALVEIIRTKSEEIDIERKPGVTIHLKRGKLHVDVKIRLLPSRRLAEVSEILQTHLTETLQEGLGIRKLGNINVMVIGVRVPKKERPIRKSLPFHSKEKEKQSGEDAVPVEILEKEMSDVDSKVEASVQADELNPEPEVRPEAEPERTSKLTPIKRDVPEVSSVELEIPEPESDSKPTKE